MGVERQKRQAYFVRHIVSAILILVFFASGEASSKTLESSKRLVEAEQLREKSEHQKALEIYRDIAGAYRADMSKEEKLICLDAVYGCIDDELALSDYLAAARYIALAEEIRDSENIEDDRLEIFYSCMYIAMSSQSGNDNMLAKAYPHALKAFQYGLDKGDIHTTELAYFHLIGYLRGLQSEDAFGKMDSINRLFVNGVNDKLSGEIFNRYYKATRLEYYDKDYKKASLEYDTILSLLPLNQKNARKHATFLIYASQPREKAGNLKLAEEGLHQGIALADSMGQHEYKLVAYELLRNLYLASGKENLASEYQSKYELLKDSISSFAVAGDIYALDNIKEEKELHRQIAKARYRSQIFLWVTVFVVSLLIVVVAFLLVLRCKNKSLAERARILRQLLREHTSTPKEDDEPKTKYLGSTLTEEEKNNIATSIRQVLDSETVFSSDFSLSVLAEKVGKSPRQVSQVINEIFNTNFSSVVNRIRIFEACRRLDSPKYANWSVEGIAESVGYTQRNTFSTNFKKYTGMGIREYRKLSEDEPNNPES